MGSTDGGITSSTASMSSPKLRIQEVLAVLPSEIPQVLRVRAVFFS